MEVTPILVGLIITIISSGVASVMVSNVRRKGAGPGFNAHQSEAIAKRLTRDLDAVQVAASVIAFVAVTVTDSGHVGRFETTVMAIAVGFALLALFKIATADENDYDHFTFWIFTPFTSVLTAFYLVALLASWIVS